MIFEIRNSATSHAVLPPCMLLNLSVAGAAYAISGPMRAGKTTTLLHYWSEHSGRKLFVAHEMNRASTRTHAGKVYDLNARTACLLDFVRARANECDCFFVDEAQFFSVDDLTAAVAEARQNNQTMLISGLDRDFRRTPFGWLHAVQWNEQVKLTALCQRCEQQRAEYTAYEGPPLDGVFAPESEHFVSCCEQCWTAPVK